MSSACEIELTHEDCFMYDPYTHIQAGSIAEPPRSRADLYFIHNATQYAPLSAPRWVHSPADSIVHRNATNMKIWVSCFQVIRGMAGAYIAGRWTTIDKLHGLVSSKPISWLELAGYSSSVFAMSTKRCYRWPPVTSSGGFPAGSELLL